jgi:hypothetical protein
MLHLQTSIPNIAQLLDALIEMEEFMKTSLFKDLLQHGYPHLTIENQNAILSVSEVVQKNIGSIGESGSISKTEWVVLSPFGSPHNACVRNIMALASDRNRFALQ